MPKTGDLRTFIAFEDYRIAIKEGQEFFQAHIDIKGRPIDTVLSYGRSEGFDKVVSLLESIQGSEQEGYTYNHELFEAAVRETTKTTWREAVSDVTGKEGLMSI